MLFDNFKSDSYIRVISYTQLNIYFQLSTYEKEVYKTEFSGHGKRDVSEMGVSVVTAIQGRMSLIQTLKSGTTISSLLVEKTNPSDSGTYQCIPSNTGPATINVHVLDGKSNHFSNQARNLLFEKGIKIMISIISLAIHNVQRKK